MVVGFFVLLFFFFFQAEDGIRDDLVTGVQTCALPILFKWYEESHSQPTTGGGSSNKGVLKTGSVVLYNQIGRASCRERV